MSMEPNIKYVMQKKLEEGKCGKSIANKLYYILNKQTSAIFKFNKYIYSFLILLLLTFYFLVLSTMRSLSLSSSTVVCNTISHF